MLTGGNNECFHGTAKQLPYKTLRGRPLVIWGGPEEIEKKNFGDPSPGKKNLEGPSPGKKFGEAIPRKK